MNNQIVISLRIRLARNLQKVIFPTSEKFQFEDAQYIIEQVKNIFKNYNGFYINNNLALALLLKEEHRLSSELIDSNNGYLLYNNDKSVSVMLNEEDHIRLQVFADEGSLSELLTKAEQLDNLLQNKLQIAKQSDIGYITACPTNIGTGLRASAMLFLPALTRIGEMQKIIANLNSNGFEVRGYFGENSQESGFMYQISNKTSLGKSSQKIVQNVEQVIETLTRLEMQARLNLMKTSKVELIDEIKRAYGILTNCYKLSTNEFFKWFALVKFGVQLGIINQNINNNLIQEVQAAHLMQIYNANMTDLQRDITRAEYVSKNLIKGDKYL